MTTHKSLIANLKRIIAFRKYHVIVIKFTETTLAEKMRERSQKVRGYFRERNRCFYVLFIHPGFDARLLFVHMFKAVSRIDISKNILTALSFFQ